MALTTLMKHLPIAAIMLFASCGKSSSQDGKREDIEKKDSNDGGGDSSLVDDEETELTPVQQERLFLRDMGNLLSRKSMQFAQRAQNLNEQVRSYCQSLQTADLQRAQNAWLETVQAWENIELLQWGPLKEDASLLRYNITSWPEAVNTCRVDMSVFSAYQQKEIPALSGRVNRQGLTALEYLLFENTLASACPSSVPMTSQWNGLATEQRKVARCYYLQALSADLSQNADQLVARWGKENENIFATFKTDAESKRHLQDVFDNLFYADYEMKYLKLAGPAGIDSKYCPQAPAVCAEQEQYRYSDFSKNALIANVDSLSALLWGDQSSGLIGLIRAQVDQPGSADQLENRARRNMQRLELLLNEKEANGSLSDLLQNKEPVSCDKESVNKATAWFCQVDDALRQLFRDIKQEYTRILTLRAPAVAQGDND